MDDLFNYSWAFWLTLALISGILETLIGSLSFLFVAIAAMITSVVASLINWELQLTTFGFTLLITLGLVRPKLLAQIQSKNQIPSRVEALVGKVGRVTQAIDPLNGLGRVEVDGQDWAAQCSHSLELGASVKVEGFDGIVLKVNEVKNQ